MNKRNFFKSLKLLFTVLGLIFFFSGCVSKDDLAPESDIAKQMEGVWEWELIDHVNDATHRYAQTWTIKRVAKNQISIKVSESKTGTTFYDSVSGQRYSSDFTGEGDAGEFKIDSEGNFLDYFYCSTLRKYSGTTLVTQEFNLGLIQGAFVGNDYLKIISLDTGVLIFQFKRKS